MCGHFRFLGDSGRQERERRQRNLKRRQIPELPKGCLGADSKDQPMESEAVLSRRDTCMKCEPPPLSAPPFIFCCCFLTFLFGCKCVCGIYVCVCIHVCANTHMYMRVSTSVIFFFHKVTLNLEITDPRGSLLTTLTQLGL